MRHLLSMRILSAVTLALAVALISCSSSGPQQAKPGTPAYFWAAAQNSYKTGDFAKVAESLDKIPATNTEYRPRADVWQLVVLGGLAKADMEWSDTLAAGTKLAGKRQLTFLKNTSSARTAAGQNSMRFVELAHRFMDKYKDEEVTLAFTKPPFAPDKPPELGRLGKGEALSQPEIDKAHDTMLKRGVRLDVELAGGADVETKIKRPAFLLYLAESLIDLADLYETPRLNHAGRLRMLLDEAKESLAGQPPSDTAKKLTAHLETMLKKLPSD